MTSLKIGSLFSGYGGLDLAVEAVTGATPAWVCEWDDAPSKVLAHHWPDVPNHRDVTTIDWDTVEPVDILTGGSPCQDLSTAGKRSGMTDGTRSNLWVNMREAIDQLHPQLVVWENVQGALSAKAKSASDMEPGTGLLANTGDGHLRALGRVLGDLTEIGYDAEWTTIRASDIGAPHHRARVFLLAYPEGERPQEGGRPSGSQAENPWPDFGGNVLPDPESRRRTIRTPENNRQTTMESWTPTDNRGTTHRGRTEPTQPRHNTDFNWGKYEPAIRHWEELTRRAPDPSEPNSKGNPQLHAPFAEWLMGLPAGWVTAPEIGLTRREQLKAIGNGVCPQQAQAALTHLLEVAQEIEQ